MLNRESTIQILYSETSGVTPDSTLLKDGELAINAADEKLFFKGSDDGLKEINSSTHSVSSINGETGDITKLYGSFRNITNSEFNSTSGITIDSTMYNSDPSGLTLSEGGVKINKTGLFKITTDVTVGLTGATPSSAVGTLTKIRYDTGIFEVDQAGTDMYHSFPRAAPGNSFVHGDTTSCTYIYNNNVIGVIVKVQNSLDFGSLGSGTFMSPAGGTRMIIEEL